MLKLEVHEEVHGQNLALLDVTSFDFASVLFSL